MKFPITIQIKGKNQESLQQKHYVAAGGEGTICQKGGTAFKLYHNPKRMIPAKKIQELKAVTSLPRVLGPQDILLDPKSKKEIGFTMPFIQDTEFICRLFNRNFRNDHNISPEMIVELVRNLQSTLIDIHKANILVVDYNEMNFLVNKKTFTEPFYIDVDSYQTPSFRATAIMESIRDRTTPKGQFSQLTDWFSFAVVSFQLYMGIHPYKGKHPDYKPKDWMQRMEDNVSVFNKETTLPGSCQDWGVIPKPHRDWFEKVFENKERSIPPWPDQILTMGITQPVLIPSTDKFEINKFLDFDDTILATYFFNGTWLTVTKKGIFSGKKKVFNFLTKPGKVALCQVLGTDPVIASYDGKQVTVKTLKDELVIKIAADAAMEYNGILYTSYAGTLNQTTFQKTPAKVLGLSKNVANLFAPATKLFKGVAVQDILGKCWMAIPYKEGYCTNLAIPELDEYRIIEAKGSDQVVIVQAEKGGSYDRFVFCFDESFKTYSYRKEEEADVEPISFTVLSNGICVHVIGDRKVEVFKDNSKVKVIDSPPFDSSMGLNNDGGTVRITNKKSIFSVKLK